MSVAVDLVRSGLLAASRPRRERSLREWVESELVLVRGPFADQLWRSDRQPSAALVLDVLDLVVRGTYTGCYLVAPTQYGKTLLGFVVPTLYHALELREPVGVGVPDLSMAGDKWRELREYILASRYADAIPQTGAGSRGANNVVGVPLRGYGELRFFTAGGSDKSRAGYTTRVLVATEIGGYDAARRTSVETDPLSQMEARTDAYSLSQRRIYRESTPSTPDSRLWRGYEANTRSRILLWCPHCGRHVHPEREHLVGWEDAQSEREAHARTVLLCPECAVAWSERDRRDANVAGVVAHAGQRVEDGRAVGDAPETLDVSLRLTCVHNVLKPIADAGSRAWRAAREKNALEAEREIRQFVWALPAARDGTADDEPTDDRLDEPGLIARASARPRGEVPADDPYLALGVDVGSHLLHWTLLSAAADGTPSVVDYGRVEVATDELRVERALRLALSSLRADLVLPGWPSSGGERASPGAVLVDCGWRPREVKRAIQSFGDASWVACRGFGVGQRDRSRYRAPRARRAAPGDGYHRVRKQGDADVVELDANAWKAHVHERLRSPFGTVGALTLPRGDRREHQAYVRHLLAEEPRRRLTKDGLVVEFVAIGSSNHWLDATAYAAVGLHMLGARIVAEAPREEVKGWDRWRKA